MKENVSALNECVAECQQLYQSRIIARWTMGFVAMQREGSQSFRTHSEHCG